MSESWRSRREAQQTGDPKRGRPPIGFRQERGDCGASALIPYNLRVLGRVRTVRIESDPYLARCVRTMKIEADPIYSARMAVIGASQLLTAP